MNDQREILHARKAHCEERVRGLKSYVKELTEMAAKHGADESLFHEDLTKAKCDIEFYEGQMEIAGEALGDEPGSAAFHVYEDSKGEWRWNLKSVNGRIVADSGQGYRDRADCLRGIDIVRASAGAPVEEGH
jgi:uncharacterized protein